jgi:Mn2+/Fe2+ NRAMP family transporter
MFTTAATLHAAGTTDVQTSSQAAEALRPIAGPFAFAIFTIGVSNKKIMGKFTVRGALRTLGWIATIVMAVATAAMMGTSFWK